MRSRELAWGIAAWPAVAVIALLPTVGGWDLSPASAAGILLGAAAAYAAAGGLLWLPAARWLDRRARRLPRLGRASAFLGLGLVIGAVAATALVAASGNATWPSSAGIVIQQAVPAGIASLLGWMLAAGLSARRRSIRTPTRR